MKGLLEGMRLLVTREADKALETAKAIRDMGGDPILFPAIQTRSPDDREPVLSAVRRIGDFDWVALGSRTAVRVLVEAAAEVGVRLDTPGRPRLAAVGIATAQELAGAGLVAALVPQRQYADGLLEAMLQAGAASGRILVLRAERGREVLIDGLVAAGARVETVIGYRTVTASHSPQAVRDLLESPSPDAAIFMSPSSFHGLLEILGRDACLDWLKPSVAAAIGDVTARAMERLGRTPDLVADSPSVDVLLATIASEISGRPAGGGR